MNGTRFSRPSTVTPLFDRPPIPSLVEDLRRRGAFRPGGLDIGLYLVRQRSQEKGVDHYGILDVGNRMGLSAVVAGSDAVVVHLRPPTLRFDWLRSTGQWAVLQKITDETGALSRLEQARQKPGYDLWTNNCEHFARYVATGKRQSTQLQGAGAAAGLAVVVLIALRSP